jgi:signal peptidase I
VASFFCGGLFAGLGLVFLGRPRRFLAWTAATLTAWIVLLASGLSGHVALFFASLAAVIAIPVGAIIDTAVVRRLPGRRPMHPLLAMALATVVSIAAAFAQRAGLLEAFSTPAGSMQPTLRAGDHFFIDKRRTPIERGDIIVFRYPRTPNLDYVKRVVAVGGDRIEMRQGIVVLNGQPLPQTPLTDPCQDVANPASCSARQEANGGRTYSIYRAVRQNPDAPAVEVPSGHFYVLGDNRENSNDSRVWGTVPFDNVRGKALFVWWSRSPPPESSFRRERFGQLVR